MLKTLSERAAPALAWAVMALPALAIIATLLGSDARAIDHAVGESGEWAARFLIVTLSITPLTMLLKGWSVTRWLRKSRRWFGVGAFAYGALHVTAYVLGADSLAKILSQVTELEYLAGWIAFAIFLPLAATSTDWAVRRLGTWWKPLQRLSYAAAAGVLLHWSLLHGGHGIGAALANFAPWFVLTGYRLWYWYLRPRASALA